MVIMINQFCWLDCLTSCTLWFLPFSSNGERPYQVEPVPEPEPETPTEKPNDNVDEENGGDSDVPSGSESMLFVRDMHSAFSLMFLKNGSSPNFELLLHR